VTADDTQPAAEAEDGEAAQVSGTAPGSGGDAGSVAMSERLATRIEEDVDSPLPWW